MKKYQTPITKIFTVHAPNLMCGSLNVSEKETKSMLSKESIFMYGTEEGEE